MARKKGIMRSPEWWEHWGIGLIQRVYPVMARVLQPEYLGMWLKGLEERLIAEGVSPERASAIVAMRQPLFVLLDIEEDMPLDFKTMEWDDVEYLNEQLSGTGKLWISFEEWAGVPIE